MSTIGAKAHATLSALDLDSPDKRHGLATKVVRASVAAGAVSLAAHIADTLLQPQEGRERTLPRQLGAVAMAAVASSVGSFVADRLTATPTPDAPNPGGDAEVVADETTDNPTEPTE